MTYFLKDLSYKRSIEFCFFINFSSIGGVNIEEFDFNNCQDTLDDYDDYTYDNYHYDNYYLKPFSVYYKL